MMHFVCDEMKFNLWLYLLIDQSNLACHGGRTNGQRVCPGESRRRTCVHSGIGGASIRKALRRAVQSTGMMNRCNHIYNFQWSMIPTSHPMHMWSNGYDVSLTR
jgi:hypothetical protein